VWNEGLQKFQATGAVLNVPAMLIVLAVTVILVRGIKESARFNTAIVFLKVAVVLAFIAFAAPYVKTENWHPFVPANTGKIGHFGASGILRGAVRVFFAYIGFDAVSTAAQEARKPQRDVPIGILASLAICTVLYIVVSLILTGVVSYTKLDVPHPIAVGVEATGQRWLATAVEIGAIAGLSSVMLVMLLGQPRIFFAMANDGLFPAIAAKIHPRYGTPYVTTIATGVFCAIMGGVLPIDILAELTSIGTLFAFALVSIGVMILRLKRPNIPRAFRVPGGPYVVPILGVFTSVGLMAFATVPTVIRLFLWMALGLALYFFYGRKHSKLRQSG
jgi:APA family basic amino acid/polyamine antiporter